jgi:hypothetical protein
MESDGLPLTRSYATIAKSLYPKAGIQGCSCVLRLPVRSGMGRGDVSAGAVGAWVTPIERQRELLDPQELNG